MARARQGGFDRLWPQVSGQPRFAGPVAYAHGPQCRRSIHVLWRWDQRLYRLSVACAGARRATESMRGRPMALTPLRLVQGSLATPAQNRAYSANNRKSRLAQECGRLLPTLVHARKMTG